ncbi:MAG: hypothetical protein KDA24_06125 [Deltaproteobacteria bacterium]|nr:hypothetical protein [Deltaproteobacteria bacterium]
MPATASRLFALLAALSLLGGCYGEPIGFVNGPEGGAGDDDDLFGGGDDDDASGDDDDATGEPVEGDADGDGIPDEVEGDGDADGDGIPNYLDPDSDGDGIPDAMEGYDDTDGDGVPDYLDTDADGDGTPDGEDDDVDGDGISNEDEGTGDSDGDGIPDANDTDSDNDGVPDDEEVAAGTDPGSSDTDGDGWTDMQEQMCGSDPTDPDDVCVGTNGIQVSGYEVNVVEVTFDTAIQMGDIMFLLDETGSMQGTLDDVADNFADVAGELDALIPDLTYGVGSFDDYNYTAPGVDPGYGMGSGDDLPFKRRMQQTTDLSAAQAALGALVAGGGDDWTESTIEALYQAASGAGYDMDCDGIFDPDTDVQPFVASPTDAFGGNVIGTYNPGVTGTGSLGGNAYRPGAVPILVYSSDATVRNAFPPYGEGPKGSVPPTGCFPDASAPMLSSALSDINAKAIGVAAVTGDPIPAMEMVAQFTDSWLDFNGNGSADAGEWMVYSSGSSAIVDQVVAGIEEFTANVTYDLEMVATDPDGAIVSVSPSVMYDVPALNTVTFTITLEPTPDAVATMFSDIVYVVPVQLLGDGGVVLAEWDLSFVVSAS